MALVAPSTGGTIDGDLEVVLIIRTHPWAQWSNTCMGLAGVRRQPPSPRDSGFRFQTRCDQRSQTDRGETAVPGGRIRS